MLNSQPVSWDRDKLITIKWKINHDALLSIHPKLNVEIERKKSMRTIYNPVKKI